MKIKKTEGGQGGKKGHSQMSHWTGTEEVKELSKKARRQQDKKASREAKSGVYESQIKKFEKFLESLKDNSNNNLIESVQRGFQACFENEEKTVTVNKDIKLKSGEVIPQGEKVTMSFISGGNGVEIQSPSLGRSIKIPTRSAVRYLSGFTKEPSVKVMERWMYDGVAKTVTGHRTEPDGHGPDGSPSWMLVVGVI